MHIYTCILYIKFYMYSGVCSTEFLGFSTFHLHSRYKIMLPIAVINKRCCLILFSSIHQHFCANSDL